VISRKKRSPAFISNGFKSWLTRIAKQRGWHLNSVLNVINNMETNGSLGENDINGLIQTNAQGPKGALKDG